MSTGTISCTYEKLIVPKGTPYWLFWPAVGAVGFLIGEIIVRVSGEDYLFWTRLLFASGLAIFPIFFTWTSSEFQRTMTEVAPVLWANQTEFEQWVNNRSIRMFTLDQWPARLVTLGIVLSAYVTIGSAGLPFRDAYISGIALVGFAPLMLVCGHVGYMLLDLLFSLRQLMRRRATVPFFFVPHPAITRIQRFYSTVAILITFAYMCLILAIWQGPYGLTASMRIWLTVLSFYPLSLFVWSFSQVHVLMQRIKTKQVELVNAEIQESLTNAFRTDDIHSMERLERLMAIQDKVQGMKEWPFALGNVATFLITLAAAATQVIAAWAALRTP